MATSDPPEFPPLSVIAGWARGDRRGSPTSRLLNRSVWWEIATKQYAGLDVSLEATSICVVDETGRILAERKVATCPDAIAGELRAKAPGLVRAGLETGPLAVWLCGELK